MSQHHDSWLTELVFGLLCLAALGAAIIFLGYWVLFGILWIVPYALFTVIPLIALTAAIGFGCKLFCTVEVDSEPRPSLFYGESIRGKKRLSSSFYPRRLIILFPLLVLATHVAVGVPEEHKTVTSTVVVKPARVERIMDDSETDYDADGRVMPRFRKMKAVTREESQIILQWPWLYNAFNRVNSSWQDCFGDSFLKQGKPYQPVLFDRNYFSFIAWLSLLLTGPILFWVLSERALEIEDQDRVLEINRAVSVSEKFWERKLEALQETNGSLRKSLDGAREAWTERDKEIAVLKAKLAFTPEGKEAKVKEISQRKGVLDSDLL